MAPRWFHLRGSKHSTPHDQARPESSIRNNTNDDDDEDIPAVHGHSNSSSSLGQRSTAKVEPDFASSTSLSCDPSSQYARRPAPIGFEQFSPPFYQRRGFSEEADLSLKVGTTLHLNHGGTTQAHRDKSEDSNLTATFDERGHVVGSLNKEEEQIERTPRQRTFNREKSHHSDEDSTCTGSHQSNSLAVLSRLPHGGKEAVIYDQKKTIRTMVTILGGWCALIAFCFGFKILSIRVSVNNK